MIAGLLGFELWEDGKKRAMFALQASSVFFFILLFILTIITFNNVSSSVDSGHTVGVFVVVYVLNAIWLFVYGVSQVFLSLYVLKNAWAFSALLLCIFFIIASQILVYVLSQVICEGCNHYLDGLFFASLSNTFAMMMVYKYWDIITAEDLEFSVSNGENAIGRYFDKDD